MRDDQSLKSNIYNSILEDIFKYEYKPNQILNEKFLVQKYGCSKSPIREALVSLCNENVLRNIPRYGYEVVRLTIEDVSEMLAYRYILESGMLTLHFHKFTKLQMDLLYTMDDKCNSSSDNAWEHWRCNAEFHLKMIAFCNNNYVYNELQKCMDRLKRAYAQFYWDKWDSSVLPIDTKNHNLILSSIANKDLESTLSNLKRDLNDFGGIHYFTDFIP